MTDIPGNLREFERWFAEVKHEWPKELQDAGEIALLEMRFIAGNEPRVIEAIKNNATLTPPGEGVWDRMMANLTNFTRLYAEWNAGKSG